MTGLHMAVLFALILPFVRMAAHCMKKYLEAQSNVLRPVLFGELPAVPNRRAGDRAQLELFAKEVA